MPVARPGAQNGQLTVMVGGDPENVRASEAGHRIAMPRWWTGMGPAGAGQLTKMVNQLCIAGIVQGLAEGIHFARSAGPGQPSR